MARVHEGVEASFNGARHSLVMTLQDRRHHRTHHYRCAAMCVLTRGPAQNIAPERAQATATAERQLWHGPRAGTSVRFAGQCEGLVTRAESDQRVGMTMQPPPVTGVV